MISASSWRPRKRAAWWVPKSELGGWKQGIQIDYMMTISINPFHWISYHIKTTWNYSAERFTSIIQWSNCIYLCNFQPLKSTISKLGNRKFYHLQCVFCRPPKDLSPKVPQSNYATWHCHENPRTCHAIQKRRWPVQPWEPIFGTWKEWEWFV